MTERQSTARRRILDAVFDLVARGGLAEASLRKVADASGINIGSVRHYFDSHEALMVAAAEEVGARMERRLAAAATPQHPASAAERRELLQAVALAVLPIAPEERAELIVLVEFLVAARIRPEFRQVTVRMGTDMRYVVRQALELTGAQADDLHTELFVAVIEGLTFELVYPHGSKEDLSPVDVLRRHIATLIP
ncbi:DNA-binding transcriptional regulator YbjK [Saccharopolyspora antimicrobica]|uniref:DNA-binding transcriptional regulator YbjK n=1 Tax=Saccharopolyspora antimicrobica TaxID=455193 RepID=A0A1I4RCC2_9PSEU|nr:TetR/AcrR family transcriptional regulator [Saccharopolyspora antimicrobica]RKT88078.1 TetR family transcriptional regulator [Saccharopolyspora antimicrobica]SFM49610.1 DNA-binding transcriptional regulator YbjK [Saccharopolyspora antimicrobica]